MKPEGILLAAGLLFLTTAQAAPGTIRYVSVDNTSPVSPYADWNSAATNIQDAVDVAQAGDTILVTNGVYATGGQKWFDSGTNRLTVTNSLIVTSVNGPAFTVIEGARGPGANAVRCALLTASAVLSGFTLTNGQSGIGNYPQGGGVYCYSTGATISNCILVGNVAIDSGGGIYRGTLVNCILKGNSATNNGGGAFDSILLDCSLLGNSARNGGGAYSGTLTNCLVAGNSAASGGGVFTLNNDHLYNCTIVSNTASARGGVYEGVCQNCIVFYNNAAIYPNGFPLQVFYSCMTPLQPGPGNFTNAPLFLDPARGDYHLQSNSPCINAGNSAYVRTSDDLDGRQRIVGGAVDIGAYEFQGAGSIISHVWLQRYGLPIDGSADNSDPDGDGLENWQEWRCGTDPTNALSVLRLLAPSSAPSNVSVSWQSVTGMTYLVERSTNLPLFLPLATNVVGRSGLTTFSDSNAPVVPRFYRVGVSSP